MKKELLIISLIIAVASVTVIIAFRIYSLLPVYSEQTTAKFAPYREDFDIVNNYLLECFNEVNTASIIVTFDYETGEFESLYCDGKAYYADERVAKAFVGMNESFGGYTLCTISITPNRINYEAFSEKVLTYTKNGKAPKYFYHTGDGVNFDTYSLWDNWYYLRLSVF